MKLPIEAKRVFKGVLFDIYQWEQELFDGNTSTYEVAVRKASVQVIAVYNGKIILANEEQPGTKRFNGFLGGWIEEGEEPLEAAKREMQEEACLISDNIIHWKTTQMSMKVKWDTHYYIAKNCRKEGEQRLDAGGEKLEPFEVNFDEFVEVALRPDFRNKEFSCFLLRTLRNKEELKKLKKLIFS